MNANPSRAVSANRAFGLQRYFRGQIDRVVWLTILFLCCVSPFEPVRAQENTPNEEQKPAAIDPIPHETPKPETNLQNHSVSKFNIEKRKKAAAGMMAIGAIAILGVAAIAITMLWARRLRRLARDLGPVQTTEGNDFWFLKPPKPTVSDADASESSHRPIHPPPDTESPDADE